MTNRRAHDLARATTSPKPRLELRMEIGGPELRRRVGERLGLVKRPSAPAPEPDERADLAAIQRELEELQHPGRSAIAESVERLEAELRRASKPAPSASDKANDWIRRHGRHDDEGDAA